MDKYERIAEIKAELNYIETHRYRLNDYQEELLVLNEKKNFLEEQLKKENQDVQDLENTTISSLFYSIIGKKEERLEKEKYEAMQASIAYHRVKNEYDILVDRMRCLKDRIEKENALLQELEILQIETLTMTDEQKNQIQMCRNELNTKQIMLKEVQEAIIAGQNALYSLHEAENCLSKAKNWGVYDLVGGDFLGTVMKHSYLDNAQKIMQTCQSGLKSFEKELKDVQSFQIEFVDLSSWEYTFDFIFDNIFTDFHVQNKISKSLDSIRRVIYQIEKTLETLHQEENHFKQIQKNMNEKIKDILSKT